MHTIIIAEAGVNHNGDLEMARKMIKAAKKAGADYIKFQTANPSLLVSIDAEKAEYQKKSTGAEESQLEMLTRLMLPFEDFRILKDECEKEGIGFLSSPFDLTAIKFLKELGMDFAKVPSGEITNLPYLREIAKWGIPVILSTGMAEIVEIKDAVDILLGKHPSIPSESKLTEKDLYLLHCNTQYPTPYEDVNLLGMLHLKELFNSRYGYSDHTPGIEVGIAAVALGASVIEKHFTLDRNLPGPDHKASLTPEELTDLIKSIRNIEKALGVPRKIVTDSERPNINIARKSIVAAGNIKSGEILTEENMTCKRSGRGISPMEWDNVVGRVAKRDFKKDEPIEL
ncbi:MAG: N-acetylneuraminate synthase [Muribaculaceae bacterium]|nr:N-acetylneuraminate synthase [Muribaculaceae bacterium]